MELSNKALLKANLKTLHEFTSSKQMMSGQKLRQSPSEKAVFFYGYILVVIVLFILIVTFGTRFAFGIFFKPMLADFSWTRAMTSGAFSLSMFMEGFLGIFMGGLNDRLGPRIVLTLCGFLLGLGYLLMSQVSAVWQLYLFYGVIIGAAMSGVWVPLLSTTARWFVERRSMMTGIVATGAGIGTLIASPISNWLISTYDWRTSYIILGSVVLITVVGASQLLRRDPTQVGQAPYGENKGEEQGLQLRNPGFSLKEALRTRQFWLVFTICFCVGFCILATMVHIVPHTVDSGIVPASAANILATIGGLVIVGRVLLGIAGDRIGNKRVIVICFILISAALFWLAPSTSIWMFYVFAITFGLGYGGIGASMSPLVAWLFGLRSHGLIFGVMALSYSIGGATGPYLLGYIFDVTGSYRLAFLACAVIGIVGLILIVLIAPTRRESMRDEVPLPI